MSEKQTEIARSAGQRVGMTLEQYRNANGWSGATTPPPATPETDQQTATRLGVSLEDYHKTVAGEPVASGLMTHGEWVKRIPRQGADGVWQQAIALDDEPIAIVYAETRDDCIKLAKLFSAAPALLRERDELRALLLAIREDIHMQGFLKDSTRENLNAVTNKP